MGTKSDTKQSEDEVSWAFEDRCFFVICLFKSSLDKQILSRSSHSQMFSKIGVLKKFTIFTGKRLCWSLFSINLQPTQMFSWEYYDIFKNVFFTEHLRWLLLFITKSTLEVSLSLWWHIFNTWISKLNSSSFWGISVSITAIKASKSSLSGQNLYF